MGLPRFFGMNPPFIGGARNILSMQTDERLIKNDVLQLVLTIPGERSYRMTFGTRVRAIVFDTVGPDDLAALSSEIAAAIRAYEERVVVNDVAVTAADDGTRINILIDMSPIYSQLTHYFLELEADANSVRVLR